MLSLYPNPNLSPEPVGPHTCFAGCGVMHGALGHQAVAVTTEFFFVVAAVAARWPLDAVCSSR